MQIRPFKCVRNKFILIGGQLFADCMIYILTVTIEFVFSDFSEYNNLFDMLIIK